MKPLQLGLHDISINRKSVYYTLTRNIDSEMYIHQVEMIKKRFLSDNKVIFSNRLVPESQVLESDVLTTRFHYDFSKVIQKLKRGRYSLHILVGLNLKKEEILNIASFRSYSFFLIF